MSDINDRIQTQLRSNSAGPAKVLLSVGADRPRSSTNQEVTEWVSIDWLDRPPLVRSPRY